MLCHKMEYILLLVVILTFHQEGVQAGDLEKYNIKVNADCSGNSIQTVNSVILEECDDECLTRTACKGFVYDHDSSQCILKRSCTNFQTSDTRDFYTIINHVCSWESHASCTEQFEYNNQSFQGCSYEGDGVTNPWCDTPSKQCSKSCTKIDLASQYGSVLTVYKRDFYDALDTATTYQMIFVDDFGQSGMVTQIHLDVGEVGRELAVGIFRNTGSGTCDLTLIREISLHSHTVYREHLQRYGVQKIELLVEDYLPVTPHYHLGLYWAGEGTLYTTDDSRALGYQLCGYDLQKSTHVRFVPYQTQSSTGSFHRHYALDLVIEHADTDLNWVLNAALYKTYFQDGVTYTHQGGTLVISDGDYSTCQVASSGLIEIDLDKMVAVKVVKLLAADSTSFTASMKLSLNDTSSQSCGTLTSAQMTSGSGSLMCADGAVGRYLMLSIEGEGASICEVEVILTHLAETCLGEDCYYIPSQLVDSAGAGEEQCRRHYASGIMLEPRDQEHWDQVANWYQQLTFVDDFTDAAVGMKYLNNAWELQSSSEPVPELEWGPSPDTYNYALLDYSTGKPTPASSGIPHYGLCQVDKSIADATGKILLRVSAGSDPDLDLYDLWTGNTITPQVVDSYSSSLVSTDSSATVTYKSPITRCKAWSYMKEVRLSFYKEQTEVAYALFQPSSTVEGWFTMGNMRGSSYHDLPVPVNSQANYASMFGDTRNGANRRWYLNAETSDCENSGWLAVLDSGHVTSCEWDSVSGLDTPQFLYSNQGSYSSSQVTTVGNDGWLKADVFIITGRFDQSSFGGLCIDSCAGMSDGAYQSCLGCNVYAECSNQTLTYHTCRNGLQFDSTASECLAESTTCTDGNALKSCETGCPSPDLCVNGSCENYAEETGLDGWGCDCDTGFTGALCEENIDDCTSDSCHFHGDCIDLVNDFNCSCHPGYTGTFCEKVDFCYQNEDCLNGGVCVDGSTSYTCNCTTQYFGDHCEYEDHCVTSSINCTGQGQCLRQLTDSPGWLCNCSDGFVGPECEFEDSCLTDTCDEVDGATCRLTTNYVNYYCECENGKIGDSCTTKSPCQNSPCEHGSCGILGSPPGNYRFICDCEGSYWSGETCSLGPCDRGTPCDNLGNCTNAPEDPDGFTCVCLHWFEGKNCSIEKPIADTDEQVLPEESGGGLSVDAIVGISVSLLMLLAGVLVALLIVRKCRQKKIEDRRKMELEKATYKSHVKDAPATFQYYIGENATQTYHLTNKDRYILTPHY